MTKKPRRIAAAADVSISAPHLVASEGIEPIDADSPSEDMFAVMLEYQRSTNKEAREDRKLQREQQSVEFVTERELLSPDDDD